jgi:beta-glucanase (GH16 family)
VVWRLDSRATPVQTGGPDLSTSPPPGYTNRQLLFDDKFSGTSLDTTAWTTYLGAQGIVWNNDDSIPLPYSAPNAAGPGTQTAMLGPSQVGVNNGLTLTAQRNTNHYAWLYPWISGVVTTEGKLSLPASGWYVQVKAKMPDVTAGMWPAIWFMPDTATSRVPEIDLFEGGWRGAKPNDIMHSDYGGGMNEYADYRDIVYNTGSDLAAAYHVYGIQYIPNVAVRYFFDGKLMFQQLESDRGGVVAGTYELLLELEVASEAASPWHTAPTAATPSASMHIAEVKVYRN